MATHLPSETYTTLRGRIEATRGKQTVKIAPNTVATLGDDGAIRVYLYGHQIADLRQGGAVWLSDAGYATQTTARRLRALAPVGYMVYLTHGFTVIRDSHSETETRLDQAGVTVY